MKTVVYSWRLSAERKAELEAGARCLVVLPTIGSPNAAPGHSDDDAEPPAIRRRAMAAIGSVAGGDPACSERAANWFAKSFAESMSSAMRSLAASAVGLIDAGAILALIGRDNKCTLLASRPTPTVDCRVLRPKLCFAEVFYRDEPNIRDARSVWLLLGSGAIPIRRSHMWTYREFRP